MNHLLLKNVRPLEGDTVDVLAVDGTIQMVAAGISPPGPDTTEVIE